MILSVSDLETLEETLDLLGTPGAVEEIQAAEAERVAYRIDEAARVIHVVRIDHRSNVYRTR